MRLQSGARKADSHCGFPNPENVTSRRDRVGAARRMMRRRRRSSELAIVSDVTSEQHGDGIAARIGAAAARLSTTVRWARP